MSTITTIRDKGGRAVKYRARYRTPAGASRSRTFTKKLDADRWLIEVEKSKLDSNYVERSAGALTMNEWAGKWIESRRGRDGAPLRPRTKALYAQLLATHIAPTLGAEKLRDLTPAVVRAWHVRLPGTTAPAKSYRLLRAMLTTAVDDELIGRNPCRVKGAGVERAPERPLPTGDEVWKLAASTDDRYRALVLLASFVGLRWGELVGLQRGDIDLEQRVVHVVRQVVEVDGELAEGPPKSVAGARTVAIPPAVVAEIDRHLRMYVAQPPSSRVFLGAKGATPRRSNFNTCGTEHA